MKNETKNSVATPSQIKLFFAHLGLYVLINIILFFISIFGDKSSWVYLGTTIVWGVLLIIHARKIFKTQESN